MQILLYHEIVVEEPQEIHAVRLAHFEQHMRWLFEAGYTVLGFEDWLAVRSGARASLPLKSVVITFDDGYANQYQNAWPVLQKYNFPATVFLVSDLVGKTSSWRGGALDYAPLMTWQQVCEMSAAGISFGSHTVNHPDLEVSQSTLVREELVRSKQKIEQAIGKPVLSFAYPMSRYNRRVRKTVVEAGYQVACVCPTGYVGQAGRDPFTLFRTTILAPDTLDDFSEKMRATLRRRLHWYRRLAGVIKRRILARPKG